jgi:hypothetical protein
MPLEELVLNTKILRLANGKGSVERFLGKAMDPPHSLSIENALSVLKSIQCLDDDENVTLIGKAVSKLPIEPKSAFTILLGSLLGLGGGVVKAIAAMSRDPFIPPIDDRKKLLFNKSKLNLGQSLPSDQFALLKALDGFIVKSKTSNFAGTTEYCDKHFLSRTALTYLADVSQQMVDVLGGLGIQVSSSRSARNSGNMQLLMAVLGMGLYPSVSIRRKGTTLFMTEKGPRAKVHPSSVNHLLGVYRKPCSVELNILCFDSLVSAKQPSNQPKSASLLMINTTPISSFALMLSGARLKWDVGGDMTASADVPVLVIIDDWLKFSTDLDTLQLVLTARSCLIEALVRHLEDPSKPLPIHVEKGLDAIALALTTEQLGVSPQGDLN